TRPTRKKDHMAKRTKGRYRLREQVCVHLLTAPLTMTTSNGNGNDGRCGGLSIIVLRCDCFSDRNYLRRRKRSGP
ncbi:hypothetical protein NXS19_004294, partial [Fusarium pseudograminearum]